MSIRRTPVWALTALLILPLVRTPAGDDLETARILEAHSFDEVQMVGVLRILDGGDFVNPGHFYNYGPVVYYAAWPIYRALRPVLPDYAAAVWALRIVSAAGFAAFVAVSLYSLRRFSDAAVAPVLLCALALPPVVYYASRAHPDLPQLAFLAAGFFAARTRPDLAAACLGLAASTKYAGFVVLPALLLFPPRPAPLRTRAVWLGAFLAALVVSQPRLVLAPLDTFAGAAAHASSNFGPRADLPPGPVAWSLLVLFPPGLGGVLPFLGVWGLVRAARAKGPDAGFARFGLAWCAIFLGFLFAVAHADYGGRHLLPLLPPLTWGGAYLLENSPRAKVRAVALAAWLVLYAPAGFARYRDVLAEDRIRPEDAEVVGTIPENDLIWAQHYIYVPPLHRRLERFLSSLPSDLYPFAREHPADWVLRRPGRFEEQRAALRALGFVPAGETHGIEVWRRVR